MKRTILLDLEFDKSPIWKVKREVIQIGAVMLNENCEVVDTFMRYVKPQFTEKLTPACTALTGISYSRLEKEKGLQTCIEAFLRWSGKGECNVYSWSLNDLDQLKTECQVKGITNPRLEVLFANWKDFQEEFSNLLHYGFGSKLSLKNALAIADIKTDAALHDALVDAECMTELFALSRNKEKFNLKTKAVQSWLCDGTPSLSLGAMFPGLFQQILA